MLPELDGVHRIALERARHCELGFDVEHDLEHDNSELVAAAMCYLAVADPMLLDPAGETVQMWPPTVGAFRPQPDPDRNLEIAGALIAAALDRNVAARAKRAAAS